jgi:hypothetical protein
MPTLEKIAEMGGISLRTVQRRVKEYNDLNGSRFGRGANDVIIDDEVLSFINEKRIGKKVVKNKGSNTSILRGDKLRVNGVVGSGEIVKKNGTHIGTDKDNGGVVVRKKKISNKEKEEEKRERFWSEWLMILPLPMLGLAASYGVYVFAVQFAPDFVAIGEAGAFELIYISLAVFKKLNKGQRKKAMRVSVGAVGVSVIYNVIASMIHFDPVWISTLGSGWIWLLCFIHGVPMAVLAFFVADLRFHTKE